MLNREIIDIGEDDNVLIETINARDIAIKFSKLVEVIKFENAITELRIGNTSISLFDDVEALVDNNLRSVYNIKKIEQITNSSFKLKSSILTKTSKFIMPALALGNYTKEYFLYDNFFENAFLNKNNINEIILIYRFSSSPVFLNFEKNVVNHPCFRNKVDVDNSHILVKFIIPDKYKEVPELFLNGKYSMLPVELKREILKFFNYKADGEMAQILYRTERRRKQLELKFDAQIHDSWELYEIPDKEIELYEEQIE